VGFGLEFENPMTKKMDMLHRLQFDWLESEMLISDEFLLNLCPTKE
jgi:hypothetical protein